MSAVDEISSFGYWLRRRRKTLDLTQEALANQVGCAVATIKKIEADERRPSREMAERLADCLAIEADERATFLRAARAELSPQRLSTPLRVESLSTRAAEASSPLVGSTRRLHNLPVSPNRLIGRNQEIAKLQLLLQRDDIHLVTLTGTGGIGKTRLACQVAHELSSKLGADFYFVSLAPIQDAALVVPAIAQTIGIVTLPNQSLLDSLKVYLRNHHTFLLLDNFEQVISAAAQIGEFLAIAPGLKLLVTSRAPLRLSGEYEFSVPPLNLPERTAQTELGRLAHCESVQLFVERAQSSGADLILNQSNATEIADICLRLDGLPLALELAATRCKLFTLRDLLVRLEHRLPLLTSGSRDRPLRQQTLRATIDWSYQLLQPAEQRLFARLSVFVGGFTLEAIESVCSFADDGSQVIIDDLSTLLDHSLIRQIDEINGERRFMLLETIREYAYERLLAQKQEAIISNQHAAYFLALAEQARPLLYSGQQQVWYQRLIMEQSNFRAALQRKQTAGDYAYIAQLGAALCWFWWKHGDLRQEAKWLEWALSEIDRQSDKPPFSIRAKALFGVAMCACALDDFARGRILYEEFLTLDSSSVSFIERYDALANLGEVYSWEGNFQQTRTLHEERLKLSREHSFITGIADALGSLGDLALYQGDPEEAYDLLEESLALRRKVGSFTGVAATLGQLSQAARDLGDLSRAVLLLEESATFCERLDDKQGMVWVLFLRGAIAQLQHDYQQASQYLLNALAAGRELGFQIEIVIVLLKLGNLALMQDDAKSACAYYVDSLTIAQKHGCKIFLVAGLEGMAGVAALDGNPLQAAELLGAAKAAREAIGLARSADEQQVYAKISQRVLTALGDVDFTL